jgi:hypothetical protein
MIRTVTVSVLVSASLLFAVPARADDFYAEANPTAVTKQAPRDPNSGLQLGLRSGFGLPFGKLFGDANVRSDLKGVIPIWVDAGYRFNPSIYVGAYGAFGYGLVNTSNNECGSDGVSCSAYDVRLGVNAQYHFRPKTSVDPWAGLGVGYEWLHSKGSGPGGSVSQTLDGFELFGLQIGADFEVDATFKLGPFVGYSVGTFGHGTKSQKNALVDASADAGISNTATHEWLTLGLRGVFNI